MKVYLLRHYDYEVQEVEGVYATKEAAQDAKAKILVGREYFNGDYTVEEWEV